MFKIFEMLKSKKFKIINRHFKNTPTQNAYSRDRIIPIIKRHNGTMYLPSMELVDIVLPELSDAFMSKHMGLVTVRYA